MSQRNSDSAETERWKKKFLDALEDQEKRERGFNNRIRLLRRGLVGVSLAGDGLDVELDRELTSLRSSLRAEESESGFEVLFEKIEKSVLRLDSRKEQSSEALQSALGLSVTQLQALELPRDIKRNIRKFAKSLPSQIKDTQNHPELIVEYLTLLKSVVGELSQHTDQQEDDEKPGFWRSMFTGGTAQTEPESSPQQASHSAGIHENLRSEPVSIEPVVREQSSSSQAVENDKSADKTASNESDATRADSPEDERDASALHSLDEPRREPVPSHANDNSVDREAARTHTQSAATASEDLAKVFGVDTEPGFSAIANHAEPALLRILENIYVSEQSLTLAKKIREKVAGGLNWYEFVAVLEDISAVITASLGQERSEFQQFLNELNESLEQVQEYVQRSRESDAQARESDDALDEEVRSKVAGIAESVRSAGNIQELKSSVQGQLESILQSMDSYKEIKQGHHQSADDRAEELEARIKVMEQESAELKTSLAQQAQQAMCDALTGLPNRAAYDTWIKKDLLEVCQKQPKSTVFVICDVDHFKNINDSYGHLAGDKVLKILAKEISGRMRDGDFFARYGGEEFVLLMPNIELDEAAAIVEPIREAVAKCPFHFKEKQVQITMSFGLAKYDEGQSPESVFEKADKALYFAKANGRNRVCTETSIPQEPSTPEN